MLIDMDSSGGALWGAKMSMEEQKGDIFTNPIVEKWRLLSGTYKPSPAFSGKS